MKKYKYIVFAGGGLRCFWEAGFWETISPELQSPPEKIASVSAGAAIACIVLAGKTKAGLAYIKDVTGRNKKNFYPEKIFSKERAMPHYKIYSDLVLELLTDKDLKKLKRGPEILIQMAHPPKLLGPRFGTFIGFTAYTLEKMIKSPVHPTWGRRVGFKPHVESLKDIETAHQLKDLILSSSCTPPFVPVMYWKNKIALDGGLFDNVPVNALPDTREETLVLLTRRYKEESIPDIPGRTYVQPSEDILIDKWDYTSPEAIQQVYDLGRRDGESFLINKDI